MRLLTLLLILLFNACISSKLPTERYSQYEYEKSVTFQDNEVHIHLKNPLHCPLRIWVFDSDKALQPLFDKINPVLLQDRSDTLLILPDVERFEHSLTFSSRLGSTSQPIQNIKVDLPFPKGKTYKVIQGNNTTFTHNTDWSRYAVDFDLKIKDTICAATDGYVVGVVDRYRYGGPGDEWKPYGNYITVYDPASGLFTQYVHMVQDGSLVNTGDPIKRGQPIALSGNTGQTTVEHLHFNVLVPVNTEKGLESVPTEFVGGYSSQTLKRGDEVQH